MIFLQFEEFLQFKEFELYWGAVSFLRSVHTSSWFLKSNWSSDFVILVTPKQEVERKSEWFCDVKFFRSKFKVEWENGVWTKIDFLASGFLFTCGNFTLIFTVFSIFWIVFLLNGFPNPFIVRSRSSFLFSQWKFFELYVKTCPAIFFICASKYVSLLSMLCVPQIQSKFHYTVNHYVKIWRVRLAGVNSIHSLSWGAGEGDTNWTDAANITAFRFLYLNLGNHIINKTQVLIKKNFIRP